MKTKNYKKLFFSFFIIIAVYTLFLMVVVIRGEIVQRKIEQNAKAHIFLDTISNQIDQQLRSALNSFRALASDQNIINFIDLKEADFSIFSEAYDYLHKTSQFMNNSQYSVGIINPKSNYVISSDGYFTYLDFLNFLKVQSPQTKNASQGINSDFSNMLFETDNKDVVLITQEKINEQLVYFVAYWKKEEISDKLLKNIVITDNQSNKRLSSIDDFNYTKIIQSPSKSNILLEKKSSILPFVSYSLTKQYSNDIPIPLISSFLIPLLLIFVLFALMITIINARILKPYRLIIAKVKEQEEPNYFSIQEAMNVLVENPSKISNFNEESVETLKDHLMKKIINQQYSLDQIKERLSLFDIQDIHQGGSLIFLSIIGWDTLELNLSNNEITQARKKFLKTIFTDQNVDFLAFDSKKFMLICYNQNQKEILSLVDRIKHTVEETFTLKVYYILSKPFKNEDDFVQILQKDASWALPLLNQVTSDDQKIDNTQIQKKIDYPIESERQLIHFVKIKDHKNAKKIFQFILSINMDSSGNFYDINQLLSALNLTIDRILIELHISSKEFYENHQKLFKELKPSAENQLNPSNLEQSFDELYYMIEKQDVSKTSTSDEIILYINAHYTEDISLGDIAEKFHLTESYISKIIKERLNVPFKNYINGLRIEKAKRMMIKYKDIKIQDCAKKVGFTNVNSFIRVFKQIEGITPGMYQKLNRENSQ
ncbi:helix-turn-helix domain-containing protein [Enterococcus sp. LJL99]